MKDKKLIKILLIAFSVLSVVIISALVVNIFKIRNTDANIIELEHSKSSYNTSASDYFENTQNKIQHYDLSETDFGDYTALYDNGEFLFVSYSDKWDEQKLQQLNEEFMKNKYGDEIKNLTYIAIYPYSDDSHLIYNPPYVRKEYAIYLNFYGFYPERTSYLYMSNENSLALVNGDLHDTVSGMSYYLSYEYGHHFAMHNLGIYGDKDDADTEYYAVRLKDFEDNVSLESDSYQEAKDDYIWSPWSLAASDYVYLMGSKTHKNIVEFYDTFEKIKFYARDAYSAESYELRELKKSYMYDFKICRNALPINNHAVPIPHLADGLKELFYSFTDSEPDEYTLTEEIGTLGLEVIATNSKRQFQVIWDTPYKDKDVIYTLMVYDLDDEIIAAHKTIYGNQEAVANVGDFSVTQKVPTGYDFQYRTTTYQYQGWLEFGKPYKFRVTITFPDNTVIISDPIEATFVKD